MSEREQLWKKHCWHPLGGGVTMGDGCSGVDPMQCCWCGAMGARRWFVQHDQVSGHGHWHTKETIRAEHVVPTNDVPERWKSECPERPSKGHIKSVRAERGQPVGGVLAGKEPQA